MAARKEQRSGPAVKSKTGTKSHGTKASTKSSIKREPSVDPVSLLTQDHVRVKKLLQRLQRTKGEATEQRQQLLKEIEQEIRTHTHIEEEIFYPAFKNAVQNADEHIYYEAVEEHHLADIVLVQIKSTDAKSEQFSARVKVLADLIEHHAEEEETEMFPKAKKGLGTARLRELGQQMEKSKQELKSNILMKVAVAAGSTLARLMKRGPDPKSANAKNANSREKP